MRWLAQAVRVEIEHLTKASCTMSSGRSYQASLTHCAQGRALHTASECFRLVFLFRPLMEESFDAVLKRPVKGYVNRLQHRHPTRDNHEVTFGVGDSLLHPVRHVATGGVEHRHALGLQQRSWPPAPHQTKPFVIEDSLFTHLQSPLVETFPALA